MLTAKKKSPGELFTLEGPLCALDTGCGRRTAVCPECGRGQSLQIDALNVYLVCPSRHVWLTDGNSILIDSAVTDLLLTTYPAEFTRPVFSQWRDNLTCSSTPLPTLMQLQSAQEIKASELSTEWEACSCGAIRSLSFNPLIVQSPETNIGIWQLRENPTVIILNCELRDILLSFDSDLIFAEVFTEEGYKSHSLERHERESSTI